MDFVPAATLWALTILRLPAALDPHRGSVFRATILAAVAWTLYVPAVYYGVNPLLGGRNRVGPVTLVSLLLGFWQFRTAIALAAIGRGSTTPAAHSGQMGCGHRLRGSDSRISHQSRRRNRPEPAAGLR